MVGEGTRGGRERRREGESKGRERGSKDATHAGQAARGREGARENRRWEGRREQGAGGREEAII